MQGAYQDEWLNAHLQSSSPERDSGKAGKAAPYVAPVPTRAAIGHAIGAHQKYLTKEEDKEE